MPGSPTPAAANDGHRFQAVDFKAKEKNTLLGFVTIITPSGLVIKDCSLHSKNQSRWLCLPSKPWTKSDGSTTYLAILDFTNDAARDRFQSAALEAVDRLVGGAR